MNNLNSDDPRFELKTKIDSLEVLVKAANRALGNSSRYHVKTMDKEYQKKVLLVSKDGLLENVTELESPRGKEIVDRESRIPRRSYETIIEQYDLSLNDIHTATSYINQDWKRKLGGKK